MGGLFYLLLADKPRDPAATNSTIPMIRAAAQTGNTNESGLHWDMVVDLRQGGVIEVDGHKVVVDGRFTKEGFPGDI